jgi:hypothetical protein
MSNDFSLDCPHCHHSFLSWNFTHNLASMAEAAGIYQVLWHPNKDYTDTWHDSWIEYTTAAEILPILQNGYDKMLSDPIYYKSFEPANRWGTYDEFIKVIAEIIQACKDHAGARPYANV